MTSPGGLHFQSPKYGLIPGARFSCLNVMCWALGPKSVTTFLSSSKLLATTSSARKHLENHRSCTLGCFTMMLHIRNPKKRPTFAWIPDQTKWGLKSDVGVSRKVLKRCFGSLRLHYCFQLRGRGSTFSALSSAPRSGPAFSEALFSALFLVRASARSQFLAGFSRNVHFRQKAPEWPHNMGKIPPLSSFMQTRPQHPGIPGPSSQILCS